MCDALLFCIIILLLAPYRECGPTPTPAPLPKPSWTPTTLPTRFPTLHASTFINLNITCEFYNISPSFAAFAASTISRKTISAGLRSVLPVFSDKAPAAFVVTVPSMQEVAKVGTVSADVVMSITFISEYLNAAPSDAVSAMQGAISLAIGDDSLQLAMRTLASELGDTCLANVIFPTVPIYSAYKSVTANTQWPSCTPSSVPSSAPSFLERNTAHNATYLAIIVSIVVFMVVLVVGALLYSYFYLLHPTFIMKDYCRRRIHDEVTRLKQCAAPAPLSPSPPTLPIYSPPRPARNVFLLSEKRRLQSERRHLSIIQATPFSSPPITPRFHSIAAQGMLDL